MKGLVQRGMAALWQLLDAASSVPGPNTNLALFNYGVKEFWVFHGDSRAIF